MFYSLLKIIRKSFKSIGKKEEYFEDLIKYQEFKNNVKKNIFFPNYNPDERINKKIKIFATIPFFYNDKKIDKLIIVCNNISKISKNSKIIILTNNITKIQFYKLKSKFKKNSAPQIVVHDKLLNNRLLPWYHVSFMKNAFKNKSYTHFLYLEDDICINKKNFLYWYNSRKFLKKFNLIPGFIRTENKKNKLYAIDFVKKNRKTKLAYISISNNYHFISHKFPYQGMYLYDRTLMKEHLNSPSSNPDCGHGAFNLKFLDKRMINLDLMAKANIGLTYINVPKGFNSRIVIPYDLNKNEISTMCFIKHLSNKYSKFNNSWFGNYKVDEVIE